MSQRWALKNRSKEKEQSHTNCHDEKENRLKETKERGFNGSQKTRRIGKSQQALQRVSTEYSLCDSLLFPAMSSIQNGVQFLNQDY